MNFPKNADSIVIDRMDVAILVFAVLLCGVGGWFMTRGRFGQRVGNVPHCRKCHYVLIGNQTGICPECGSLLSDGAVVMGHRPLRPRSLVGGAVLLVIGVLIAASAIAGSVMKVDWYRYRPTRWVIQDLDATVPGNPEKAWIELKCRLAAGGISAANEHALIERGLREQQKMLGGSFFSSGELVDHLGEQYVKNCMDAGEVRRFFDNMTKLGLEMRPIVGPTDPIAYRVRGLGRGPGGWYIDRTEIGFWIDDKKIESGRSTGDAGFAGVLWNSTLKPQPIGDHRLRIAFQLGVVRRGYPIGVLTVAEQSRKVELSAPFVVSPSPPPIVLGTSPDAATIGRCFSTHGFLKTPAHHLEGTIKASNPPVSMAFKVLVKVHGKEFAMGNIHFDKVTSSGASWFVDSAGIPPGDTGPIDIILRSSEQAAVETPDITQIWKGEIIIRNVAVQGE